MRFAIAAAAVALTTGVTAQWDNPIPDFEVYMYAEEDCKFENNPVLYVAGQNTGEECRTWQDGNSLPNPQWLCGEVPTTDSEWVECPSSNFPVVKSFKVGRGVVEAFNEWDAEKQECGGESKEFPASNECYTGLEVQALLGRLA